MISYNGNGLAIQKYMYKWNERVCSQKAACTYDIKYLDGAKKVIIFLFFAPFI